jgi:ADP-heptose:LPS heptosyltransferase
MKLKTALRGLLLDWLADRDDRYYWRQPVELAAPPQGATLCIWQPDGKLGDSVIHTCLIHSLATHRPDLHIVIVCAPGLVAFWERLPGVTKAIGATHAANATRQLLLAGLRIDMVISMEAFLSLDTTRFIRAVRPDVAVGLNVGRYRLFTHSIADNTYDHPRRHVTQRLGHLCELMSIPFAKSSGLPTVAMSGRTARVTLPNGVRHVFLNVYGTGLQKAFNDNTLCWLIRQVAAIAPQTHIILNVPGDRRAHFEALIADSGVPLASLAPAKMELWELIALMQQCMAVITPDTGIGHIAAALRQPVMVFFEDIHYTPIVWAPDALNLKIVTPRRKGNVNDFDPEVAVTKLADLLCSAEGAAR